MTRLNEMQKRKCSEVEDALPIPSAVNPLWVGHGFWSLELFPNYREIPIYCCIMSAAWRPRCRYGSAMIAICHRRNARAVRLSKTSPALFMKHHATCRTLSKRLSEPLNLRAEAWAEREALPDPPLPSSHRIMADPSDCRKYFLSPEVSCKP